MEGHAGQATDVRAAKALKRPVVSARRAADRLRPGTNEAGGRPVPGSTTVHALRQERRAGTLNSPERIERAARRLLGG